MLRGYRSSGGPRVQDEYVTTSFQDDTRTSVLGPGVRTAMITDRWNTPLGKPNGGYALALCLRAAYDELDVGRPAAVSISYLASPEPGVEAEFRIRAIKLGRRVQTAEVEMTQTGRPVLHVVATFLRDHSGFSVELGEAPTMPPPEDCFDPKSTQLTPDGLFERLDHRWPEPPGWAIGEPNGNASFDGWIRLAGGEEIDWFALALLCDASPPPIMELGSHISMTVQLTVHLHRLPEPGAWVASRMFTKHAVNGMHEEDGELWDEHGNLLAQSRQLAILL